MRHLGTDVLPAPLRSTAALSVLDVTEWYGETSGGIRTYLDEKARYVAARPDLRHVVVVPGSHDDITDRDGVRHYRLRGPRIPRHRPYRFMLATRSLSRIVRHERPDVIELGSPFVIPWIVAPVSRALGVPVICFHHTNLAGLASRTVPGVGWMGQAVQAATRRYLRRLDALAALTIVASRSARDELHAAGIDRIAEVPLGVDTAVFSPTLRAQSAQTRARWGLPDAPLAGFVGRFATEKALDMVMNAWPTVERLTDARLVLIGGGPLEARLRAHPYGARTIFLPFQTNRSTLAELMAAMDVMVAPSPVETFGLSALEGLACGTPLLSANRGGVSEQVEASGAGCCFEAGSADSLAEAAVALFRGDLAGMSARGREYAVREHAWPAVLNRLFQVYRNVVAA